jgi:3-methyladenine DNA glycosylase AlkD
VAEAEIIRSELRAFSDPAKAKLLAGFFKTGKGEYGEGDRFLGVVVPNVRKVAKKHLNASGREIKKLLYSPFHEERLAALLILVEQYRRGDEPARQKIYDLYLAGTSQINNWDLVDLSAQHIVGEYLIGKDRSILTQLALSDSLWERRIAILSTLYFIRKGQSEETLRIAELLLHDSHDLIHKAVGWMLREVGNRCSLAQERKFLDRHASAMPRTMLRYAIERFSPELRSYYMHPQPNCKNRRRS